MVCVQKVQKILIFEVFPSTELRNSVPRFRKLTEFTLHNHIQMVDIINDRLAVATDKFIAFYNLYDSKRYDVISHYCYVMFFHQFYYVMNIFCFVIETFMLFSFTLYLLYNSSLQLRNCKNDRVMDIT